MIPRRIHYCWFGGAPLPLQAKRCLASWAYFLPDYEILRWDESNFDPTSHPFTAAAYLAGRYAFVSDYVRMLVLHEWGGIYCDVDLEILHPLDELLPAKLFIGLEDTNRFSTSIIGAGAGHWLSREMLAYYDSTEFDSFRISEMVNVNQVSRLLLAYGFSGKDEDQEIGSERVLRIGRLADARGTAEHGVRKLSRHLYAGTWRTQSKKTLLSRIARSIRKFPSRVSAWAVLLVYRLGVRFRRTSRKNQ